MRRRKAKRTVCGFMSLMLLPVLAAGVFLVGSAAWAEDPADAADTGDAKDEEAVHKLTTQASEIELGVLANDINGDPSAFAQYRGLDDNLIYGLGNVDIFRRAPWDSQSTEYFRIRGLNLGLDSRYVDARFGQQGKFGLSFFYNQLPVYKTQSASTFFLGNGSSNLTLPPGWVAGARGDTPLPGDTGYPTAFQSSINDNLDQKDIGWQRRKLGGGFSVVLPSNMEFTAGYSYETKKGEKLIGSEIGINGGNPRAVIIPERIDYQTHQINSALRYGRDGLQLELEYFGSAFNDDENYQRWMNPFNAGTANAASGFQGPPTGVIAACVGVPTCGTGQRSQPPDNWFNEIIASGGYDLPYQTRVTLRSAFSWATQDDNFLPYTVNPVLTAVTPTGVPTNGADLAALPRRSLDGEIFTSIVDFGIASRPLEKVRLDTSYRFERRDNNTPRDLYIYIPGDATNQGTVAGANARINRPYDLTRQQVVFDAGYELPLRSEVALGYEWERTDRSYQEVDELQANTVSAKLTSRPTSYLNTRIRYEHTWRNGSQYDGSTPFLEGDSQEALQADLIGFANPASSCALAGLTPQECLWENHPLLRKYYLANLHRDKIGAIATLLPREDLAVTLTLNWWNDKYYATVLGLTSAEHQSPGVDLAYTPNDWLSIYSFYSYERTVTDSSGWEFTNVQQSLDPTRRWSSKESVYTHTAGVGFNADIIPDRLGLGVDYVFAKSRGKIDTVRAPGATLAAPTPFPDLISEQHNVSLHADYRFTDQLSMRVGYLYQYLATNDWAYDNLDPTSITCSANACVIGTGQESPHYTGNVVSWSMLYKFW